MNNDVKNEMPGGQLKNRAIGAQSATTSEMFPVFAKRKELVSKGFLIPVGILFVFVLALTAEAENPAAFRNIFGVFLGVACYFVIYMLCGKAKAWYAIVGSTAFTMLLMVSPLFSIFFFFFYNLIGTPQGAKFAELSFPRQVIGRFLSTGAMEELVKIIPVLLIWKYTKKLQEGKREKVGVTEPLDGILLAAASALGFVFIETLGQYAPGAVKTVAGNIGRQLPGLPPELLVLAGDVFGLQSVIYRILPELSGHLAYSAYFGYFVGLAAMKPKHAWKLLGIGYICAAGLHAIWDLFCDMPHVGLYLQLPMMLVFFACMVGAILKARQISPSRQQNFATVLVQTPGPAVQPEVNVAKPQVVPVKQAAVKAAPIPAVAVPAVAVPAGIGLSLKIGKNNMALHDGQRFAETEIPGLRAAAADNAVAMVSRNPKDPTMIGLQNLSKSTWKVALPTGEAREVANGRSVRLLAATRIDFGSTQAEVL